MTNRNIEDLSEEEVTRRLAYAGLILVAWELIARLIVNPIKLFYRNTTFGNGMPFKSYKEDVLSHHPKEFQACLLYLRDFMGAVNNDDVDAIVDLRKHRNELAHELSNKLTILKTSDYEPLLQRANRAFFKLSNYRTKMEIAMDLTLQGMNIDWDYLASSDFRLLQKVIEKTTILSSQLECK